METHERGGLQDDRGPDQAAWAHEECTHAGDHAISRPEIGPTVPGPIEDQQLVLDEHGFSDLGPRAAGTGQPGDSCPQVQKKNRQIAHRTILPTSWNPRIAQEFRNSPYTSAQGRGCNECAESWICQGMGTPRLPGQQAHGYGPAAAHVLGLYLIPRTSVLGVVLLTG